MLAMQCNTKQYNTIQCSPNEYATMGVYYRLEYSTKYTIVQVVAKMYIVVHYGAKLGNA